MRRENIAYIAFVYPAEFIATFALPVVSFIASIRHIPALFTLRYKINNNLPFPI